jgi:hypothetical protein
MVSGLLCSKRGDSYSMRATVVLAALAFGSALGADGLRDA